MKVLVTGGGGFLGAWVARRLLAKDVAVRIFDASADRFNVDTIVGDRAANIEWVVGDVGNPDDVSRAMAGCDHVVHLAGLLTPACQDNPVRGATVNVIGTINVFEAAKQHGLTNVVYTSSVSVFGPENGDLPNPSTHYGAFKLAAEGSARSYWEYDGISSVGLRPGVVYGPGRESGLSAGPTLACKAAVQGNEYTMGYTGDACLVYVDDVAAAYEYAVLTPPKGAHVFNVSGSPISTDTVIQEIKKHYPAVSLKTSGSTLPFTAHISDLELYKTFPSLTRTDLDVGIRETLDHYEALA
jgi:nucleoside-diphosphate-sugar epimerase